MKKIINVCFLVLIFLFITPVYAKECTDEDIEYLTALAEKIEISYEFVESEEGNHSFNLIAYNLDNRLYLHLPNGGDVWSNSSKTELGLFWDDKNFDIKVYGSEHSTCEDEELYIINVELPYYNEYSKTEECSKNKELDVCKEFYYTSDISEEEFKEIIKNHNEKPLVSNGNKLVIFIKEYWLYLLIGMLVILVPTITYVVIKNKKRVKIDI